MWWVWKCLVQNCFPFSGQTIAPASFKQQLLVYFLPQQIIFFSTWSKPKNLYCPGTNQEHRCSLSWGLGGRSLLCHDDFLAHCPPALGSLCSCRHWNKALQWQRQADIQLQNPGVTLWLFFLTFIQASLGGSSGHSCTGIFVINSRQLGTFFGMEHLALSLCSLNFHTGAIWCDSAMAGGIPLPLDLLHNHFCICTAWDTRADQLLGRIWSLKSPEVF